jgi:GT2 family glycosyltransferase
MATSWIILVNWNGSADTIECLESLLRMNDGDWRVAVVDNGSTDGSVAHISAWAAAAATPAPGGPPWAALPRERVRDASFARVDATSLLPSPDADITLIEAGQNLGFAAANNLGMRFAAADPQARFYWILNNDTVVAPDSLFIQRQRMEADPSIGMLGARLMFYADPHVVQGLAGGFYRRRARGFHIGLGLDVAAMPSVAVIEREMAYALGASMFVPRALVDRIGGMSEAYFLYFEELDWARRLPTGYRLAVAPEAVVWHKEGGSIGSATRSRPSDTSLYYINAGLLRFYWRHDRALLPIALARVLREAAGHVRRGDRTAAATMLRALADVPRGIRRRGHYGSTEFERTDR